MVLRMTVGLVLTVVAFAIAGRRLWWLKRLALSGQPAPERIEARAEASRHGTWRRRLSRWSGSASCLSGRCPAWRTP